MKRIRKRQLQKAKEIIERKEYPSVFESMKTIRKVCNRKNKKRIHEMKESLITMYKTVNSFEFEVNPSVKVNNSVDYLKVMSEGVFENE